MRNLQPHLDTLHTLIDTYQATPKSDGNTLVGIAHELSVTLFWLCEEKTKEHENFEKYVFALTSDKKLTVARAINAAELEYPNLYRLRYAIRAGYAILDIIRTQVSYLKTEMSTLK
jgi:hypothetical protein